MIYLIRCISCKKYVGWKLSRQFKWGVTSTCCDSCMLKHLFKKVYGLQGRIKILEGRI